MRTFSPAMSGPGNVGDPETAPANTALCWRVRTTYHSSQVVNVRAGETIRTNITVFNE